MFESTRTFEHRLLIRGSQVRILPGAPTTIDQPREGGMISLLRHVVNRSRVRADSRRKRPLHQVAAEMRFRERNREGSIWRSGKGGFHHDR